MLCGAVPDSSVPGLVWPMARDQSVLLKVLDALRNTDADRIKQAADTIDLAAPGSLGRPHRRAGQPRGADEASLSLGKLGLEPGMTLPDIGCGWGACY